MLKISLKWLDMYNRGSELALKITKLASVAAASLAILFAGLLAYSFLFSDCAIDREYSRAKVEKYLAMRNLPLQYLVPDEDDGHSCSFSFMYEGAGEKIHFMVVDDFVRGPKLTLWDYNVNR